MLDVLLVELVHDGSIRKNSIMRKDVSATKVLGIENLISDCVLLYAALVQLFFVLQSIPAPLLFPFHPSCLPSPVREVAGADHTHTSLFHPAVVTSKLLLWVIVQGGSVCVCRSLEDNG